LLFDPFSPPVFYFIIPQKSQGFYHLHKNLYLVTSLWILQAFLFSVLIEMRPEICYNLETGFPIKSKETDNIKCEKCRMYWAQFEI